MCRAALLCRERLTEARAALLARDVPAALDRLIAARAAARRLPAARPETNATRAAVDRALKWTMAAALITPRV